MPAFARTDRRSLHCVSFAPAGEEPRGSASIRARGGAAEQIPDFPIRKCATVATAMLSSKVPLFIGALAATLTYAAVPQQASACDCEWTDVSQDFARAKEVFSGQVIFGFQVLNQNYYLIAPQTSYKGCQGDGAWVWIQSERDGASCGTSFAEGGEYVFFSYDSVRGGFAKHTDSCSGNRRLNGLTEKEKEFLDTRENCCGGDCYCAGGGELVGCPEDECAAVQETCEAPGVASCRRNGCRDCAPEYLHEDGGLLCEGLRRGEVCQTDKDCAGWEYCGLNGSCVPKGQCSNNAECNLPGNKSEAVVDCEGSSICVEGRCAFECGDARCVDHEGYDFGDCDAYIGWVVSGGQCVLVSSGCGSLIPGSLGSFASKQDCEASCEFASSKMDCGPELSCDIATSYCLITTPGVQPRPGDPSRYYDCMDLPDCGPNPSCESCFGSDRMGPYDCSDLPSGGIVRSIFLP